MRDLDRHLNRKYPCGISKENIKTSLKNFKLSPHRLEKFETKKYTAPG